MPVSRMSTSSISPPTCSTATISARKTEATDRSGVMVRSDGSQVVRQEKKEMYGTIARMQAKPGMQDKLLEFMGRQAARSMRGYKTTYVYHMDADPNAYM